MGRFSDLFAEADADFNGAYKSELEKLNGLSKEEINSITPDTEDLKTYSVLIKVVEKASKDNISKAELIEDIKELGDVAIKIAKKVAYVLSGGDLTGQQKVSEQYLLDIEREAFISLCGEQKTLERIQHMLTTNKPLRN